MRGFSSLCLLVVAGCTGVIDSLAKTAASSRPPAIIESQIATSGLRRLTRVELDATVRDLLGDDAGRARRLMPADATDPFDNDYHQQLASGALVEAAEALAMELADVALVDPLARAQLIPCMPVGAADAACLRAFVEQFGRRAFRRPLTQNEVDHLMTLQPLAEEAGDFDVGIRLVIRALLQHPAFLYRVEVGDPGTTRSSTFRLSSFELATRLSYFLIGTTPPEWLLDEAQAGQLNSKDGLTQAAKHLLTEPLARTQVERFHSLWLGYHQLPHPLVLTQALQNESNALVDRVVFTDSNDYFSLFTATDSFVNSTLAQHYQLSGFTGDTEFRWTPYGNAPRKGLLSHGSVLSQGVKFNDTSPTQRGKFIRNRLLCQEIPPPPPGVDVDAQPVSTSPCKKDKYLAHASGGCKGCHASIDPIGFGLERFDRSGRYRETDDNDPTCAIEGKGTVVGASSGDLAFSGPDGLADALIASGAFEHCVVTQVFRFAHGRREEPADALALTQRTDAFVESQRNFQTLLLSIVTDEAFSFARDEEVQ